MSAARRWAVGVLLLLPALMALHYIFRFSVDVPYWDDWELVPLLRPGAPTWDQLVRLHMEHRIFFARLVMLLWAKLLRYDTRADMYTTWALLCATTALLAREHHQAFGARRWLLFVPVAWLVFTLRQHANLLWGWQVQIALATAAPVAAFYCLSTLEKGRLRLPAALAFAGLGAFSFSSGMAVWPAGLAQLLAQRGKPRAVWAWLTAAAAAFTLYLWGYRKPGWPLEAPSWAYLLERPTSGIRFALAVVGNALWEQPAAAMALGLLLVLGVGGFAVAAARGQLDRQRAGLGVALLVLGAVAAAMVIISRAGFMEIHRPEFGLDWATHSRYVTLVVFIVIGLYRLALSLKDESARRACSLAVAALVAASAVGSLYRDYPLGEETRNERLEMVRRLRSFRERSDQELLLLFWLPETLRERATFLERNHLSVFR